MSKPRCSGCARKLSKDVGEFCPRCGMKLRASKSVTSIADPNERERQWNAETAVYVTKSANTPARTLEQAEAGWARVDAMFAGKSEAERDAEEAAWRAELAAAQARAGVTPWASARESAPLITKAAQPVPEPSPLEQAEAGWAVVLAPSVLKSETQLAAEEADRRAKWTAHLAALGIDPHTQVNKSDTSEIGAFIAKAGN